MDFNIKTDFNNSIKTFLLLKNLDFNNQLYNNQAYIYKNCIQFIYNLRIMFINWIKFEFDINLNNNINNKNYLNDLINNNSKRLLNVESNNIFANLLDYKNYIKKYINKKTDDIKINDINNNIININISFINILGSHKSDYSL